ncbi:MAG: isoleucine--tRNA ligase [Paludibacteraceae bacterium]|nr:isoleucine--tRNA ligase [Paludibacteraceae bacterium]MBQ2065436.1 isoleucine--tRNA ligase [Paludibacteraceae bacterium]
MSKKFAEYQKFNLSDINKQVCQDWENGNLFKKSIDTREGYPSFIFYEGPPSANGMPGIHHVMARTIKDTFCRFKTMQGFQVKRKAGWDTHGLPVELGVEKKLGITKEDIGKKISVDQYNAECRSEVMKYTREWTLLTKKMGYWVDLDNPYITYDNKYIESLWWLLKELYNKGLLYKGYTIQPYSPAAGTGLSTHELNQPGCYRDVKDTTVTAQFKIKGDKFGDNAYFLAWTTTPWTLPSNTALCVGPKIDYVVIKSANPYTGAEATYIMAKALVSNYFGPKKAEPFEIVGECKGTDLVGIEYEQLIPWVNPGEGAFRVIPGDYVTTEDGTGIVHIAPTFGADDAFVAKKAGVPGLSFPTKKGELRPMVDMTGKFFLLSDIDDEFVKNNINTELYKEFEGRFVKNAYDPNLTDKDETLDISICMMLKQQGKAFKIEKHVHNYPHCWRTDKPVLYYPLDSWFIKTTACRDRMIELNKTINWKPESTGTGRFGKWLENLQDWNLSRSRYWGTPLPIWRTDDGSEEICIGSMEELMAEIEKSVAAGVMSENPYKHFKVGDFSKENYAPENIDLHRPYIDSIILVSKDGKPMKRETDLIDVWFDSGSMPYAQLHYPFENKELIDTRSYYPADFISEGVDQTRGWFFTLHAIATMVFDSVAFKNVISNGLVLDKNGNKMSKRLGNAVDPFGAIEKYGSDPLRWYMMTNSAPWDNLKFDEEGVEEISRKFFGTLYNTYSFFALYANVDGFTYAEPDVPTEERQEIDRWILSLLNTLTREVQDALESYEPTRAGRAIQDFVTENLSNWYVRLNRKRFWAGKMDKDKLSAYQTLYTCLETVSLLMAPIAPFYADRIFRDLNAATGRHNVESVHLATFPKYNEAMVNKRLEEQMELAQKLTSLTLALRKKADIKVRQPLSHVMIPTTVQNIKENLESVADLIKAEVNVKEIKTVEGSDGILVKRIKPDFKKLGPKCGKAMKSVAATLQALPQEEIRKFEENGVYTLCIDGNNIEVSTADVEIFSEDIPGWLVANDGNLTIALDITVTEELRQEGLARELVNRIQNMRKQSGLNITDKINITVCADAEYCRAIEAFAEYIKQQVLGLSITTADTLEGAQEWDVDGKKISVKIEKA